MKWRYINSSSRGIVVQLHRVYTDTQIDDLPVKLPSGETAHLTSLRTPPSKYSNKIRYTLHEFPQLLDSSSINAKGWSQIAACVEANYSLYDGFVILHGTDSLAYSASALSFMFSSLGKTVILTGSQSPIFALQSDAVDNLLGSLIIAGTFVIPEVCLFFHHTLYRGNRTTKISASSFEAFASPNIQPLATVNGMQCHVSWPMVRRSTSLKKFSVQYTLDTDHVACLRIFPGITPQLIDAVLRLPKLRGLILETFGAGNAPADEELMAVIRGAIEREIVIVNVSQCPSGTVSPLYAPAHVLGSAGVVFGHDLTTEAALTKLFYLLERKELSYAQIVDLMAKDLRGEMTELPSFIQFAHSANAEAGASLSDKQKAFTELMCAISNDDYDLVKLILDSDTTPEGVLFDQDYLGNTPLHAACVGEDSDAGVQILTELLIRGCSVHVRNRGHNTPLWLAEKLELTRKIELLKEAGALLNVEEDKRYNMRDAGAGMSRVPSAWQSRRTSFNDERPILTRANTLSHMRNISNGPNIPASSNEDRSIPVTTNKPIAMADTATGSSTPSSSVVGEQRIPVTSNKPFTMIDSGTGTSTPPLLDEKNEEVKMPQLDE